MPKEPFAKPLETDARDNPPLSRSPRWRYSPREAETSAHTVTIDTPPVPRTSGAPEDGQTQARTLSQIAIRVQGCR